jgi:hypothetical protein
MKGPLNRGVPILNGMAQLACESTIRTASDLLTIQFRLIFKGHKSLEYWCLVIHLKSVSTIISYAESNGGIFILIAPLGITNTRTNVVRVICQQIYVLRAICQQ